MSIIKFVRQLKSKVNQYKLRKFGQSIAIIDLFQNFTFHQLTKHNDSDGTIIAEFRKFAYQIFLQTGDDEKICPTHKQKPLTDEA